MRHLLKILIIAISISGCQEEYEIIIEPDKSESISADDNIANLILNVTLKDGSFDNLIDECSEISIKFPYLVIIEDDYSMQINSTADVDNLYMEYFQNRDDIEIQYPITVIYSDYKEKVIYDSDELDDIQEQYNNQLIDNDIECIDFIYPVEINIYNTTYQKTDYFIVGSDAEMYDLFEDLTDIILGIEFPVELTTFRGEIISIVNNVDLEDEINNYKDDCDENDGVEFEDDDDPFYELISSGSWKVSYYSHTSEQTLLFNPFKLDFNSDFSLSTTTSNSTIEGTWEYDNDRTLDLELETEETPLVWLNHEWDVVNVNVHEIQLQTEEDFDGYVKKLTLQRIE